MCYVYTKLYTHTSSLKKTQLNFIIVTFCERVPPISDSLFHSEDYYGDLDLKSIRKSELLAGLQNTGEARAVAAKAAVSAAVAKPRPQPAKEA